MTTKQWEYNGKKPELANLGFMQAFQSSDSGGDVVYTRFYRVYLPSYVVSAIALIALAVLLLLYWQRAKSA